MKLDELKAEYEAARKATDSAANSPLGDGDISHAHLRSERAAASALIAALKQANRCCERDHDGDGNCDKHPVKGPFINQLREEIKTLRSAAEKIVNCEECGGCGYWLEATDDCGSPFDDGVPVKHPCPACGPIRESIRAIREEKG